MLVSQRDDHKRNFLRTLELANLLQAAEVVGQPMSRHGASLLRFYAVESGLKYLLNLKEQVPFSYEFEDGVAPLDVTAGYPGRIEGYSHDLPRMLRRLNVAAASVTPPAGPFKTLFGYKGGQSFFVSAAHEAWRYGLQTDPADQLTLESFLTSVVSYIENEI
jgi:hypothetical protein